MKKVVVWLLTVCLLSCFVLASCGKENPEAGKQNGTPVSGEEHDSQSGEQNQPGEGSSNTEPEELTPDDNLYGNKNWTKNY